MSEKPLGVTFGELLRSRAAQQPDRLAYRFLGEESQPALELTYRQLVARALSVANGLRDHVQTAGRVLLLCSMGANYVIAFHACQLLGAIAVPAYPPRGNRNAHRILQIIKDCTPDCILTDNENLASLQSTFGQSPGDAGSLTAAMVTVESLLGYSDADSAPVQRDTGQPAFLQYTSGSTGTPKGVMVSHANIMANLHGISRKFEADDSYRTVFWLPPYHDMGLVGGILHPIFGGYPVTLMSPFLFVQSPIRWLRAIAADGATASAAPNFGYQACIDRITPQQCEALDLSCWKIAICGGERVMKKTMDEFARKFAPYGFDASALYPTYGMAEATLLMTGGRKSVAFNSLDRFEPVASQGPSYDDVVSCGTPMEGHQLLVVDTEASRLCADGEVGEIWYAGASVAQGYWNKPAQQQAEDFHAQVPGANGAYLRTGDLGTRLQGEIYILGRTKEMIIVRGANFYPTDLEQAVATAHPAIDGGAVAAFAAQREGVEGVVLAAEIRRDSRKADVEDIKKAVVRALVEAFDIRPLDVVVLRPAGMLRTSSGKIRRSEMALAYRANQLPLNEPLPNEAKTP